jgi:hypothetical protein
LLHIVGNFPAKALGIGKRAIITAIPMNALQPRMLYRNQMHTAICSGKYKTERQIFMNKDERAGREEDTTTNRNPVL